MSEREKISPDLAVKLEDASPSDKLRVIGVIAQSSPAGPAPTPAKGGDRVSFRARMIQTQQGVHTSNSAVLSKVKELGLAPAGGVATGTFVVDASPGDVLRLSRLDGITSLSLDKRLDLIRPKKSQTKPAFKR